MKTIWNIIAVIALANLIAVLSFVGFLVASDRLNMERASDLRQRVAKTVSTQKQEEEAERQKAIEENRATEEAKKANRPALTAAEQLAARIEATELDRQRADRMKTEVASIQVKLTEQRDALIKAQKQLDDDRKAFEAFVAQRTALDNDVQFQKTLGLLASVKPSEAKAMLSEILLTGEPAAPNVPSTGVVPGGTADLSASPTTTSATPGMRRVIQYLDALDDRPRTKILSEFIKADPKLAAELLEGVRNLADFRKSAAATP
jgi:hypothetical protein